MTAEFSGVFFRSRQRAFDGAPVHGQAKVLLDALDQGGAIQLRLILARFLDEAHDVIGNLVGSVGPAFDRQQSHQPGAREVGLRLVEGWPRDTESRDSIGDGQALGAHTAKHLVPNLHQIVWVEEIAADEGVVMDHLGVRIDGTALVKSLPLRGELGKARHM